MNEESFVKTREPDWKRLFFLNELASGGPHRLSPSELKEYLRLYRSVSRDLAITRTQSANEPLLAFLNAIVGTAYSQIYRAAPKSFGNTISDALTSLAAALRRRSRFVQASLGILFVGLAFGLATMALSPGAKELYPEDLFAQWKTGRFQERSIDESAQMWGLYATNNPKVAVITGTVGAVTLGIGSAVLMFSNGQILGALSWEMISVGKLGHLYASILPHGVPEMGGMILTGAAGLLFGWAIIAPGRRTRLTALKQDGRDAITLLTAGVLLMYVAAPIEGFFSFNPVVPVQAKVVWIAVEVALVILFWMGYKADSGQSVAG